MDASMSMVTLGVRDLETSRRFYLDGLGWSPAMEVAGDVTFIQVGPAMLLGLWSRAKLSDEAGGLYQGDEAAPISLAHMVADPESVARVLDDATRAGGVLIAPSTEREWGGVTGYFADPDGYRWEVAYNPSTDPVLGPILGPGAAAARQR
ncbi:VOC family protein [Segeticoccus rhizosphaerae]|jgi:catechol 2,3-dioxygenase-like lactoylglutathione lyase family enzyme|uniref:VOC family protein n=1 Tax=Segeticoccus rhizosphaerae TaxID=1104777 RepID=UPI0010C0289B|nr:MULTISPECIES: VOC family protein [Intrasporangiaceae]